MPFFASRRKTKNPDFVWKSGFYCLLQFLSDELGQRVDAVHTENEVHVGVALAQLFYNVLLVGHAAAEADDEAVLLLFQALESAHVTENTLLGVLTDGAGVEKDHFPFDERGCGGEQMKQEKTLTIPLDRRVYLSLEEAMSYTGLDEKTLRKLSDGIYNSFVLWAGRRRLLKREMLEEYLENEVSAENEENQE